MRLGIDFGTTNSAAAIYDGERLHPIEIHQPEASAILPSLLYIDREHHAKMGLEASAEYVERESGRAVRWRSRQAGTLEYWVASTGSSPILVSENIYVTFDDAAYGRLLQSIKTGLRNEQYNGTQIFDRYYTLDELIALVLGKLKAAAEEQLGQECAEVVIGRPVKFSEKDWVSNRAEEIIYKAALSVGFKQISFQAEPIGALYVYHTATAERTMALVFDFGGGTLDLTVAEVGAGITPRVLATRGVLVGGDDLDKRMMQSLLKYFGEDPSRNLHLPHEFVDMLADWQTMPELSRPHHEDTLRNLRATSKHPETIDALRSLVTLNLGYNLFQAIEGVKKELSTKMGTTLKFQQDKIRIFEYITRWQFESMIKAEVKRVKEGLDAVLEEAALTADQIDVVLRTGGSSLVPAFVKLLADQFGAEKIRDMDPLVSVVGGLSIIAHEDGGLRGNYRGKYVGQPTELVTVNEPATYKTYMLGINQRCFIDQDTVLRRLPVELSGFPTIMPAYTDRDQKADDFLRFTLAHPARVYVAYGTGAASLPNWLREFTQLEDFTLEIEDEWYGVRRLQIYRQDFPAGEVVLGGNAAAGAKGKLEAPYIVILEKKAEKAEKDGEI
ncbi:MAG: Hsp70 family protein [Chloroflexi bacterium]|nr:Hsp70 family protein [Chloroflexota bacterium]